MKRMQYEFEAAGVIFGTREQVNAVVKALTVSLANIDVKGGITKVEIELKPLRVNAGTKKRSAPTPALPSDAGRTAPPRKGEGNNAQVELQTS